MSTENQIFTLLESLESQLFFNWIDDLELRFQLTEIVKNAKQHRLETQREVAKTLSTSLTKIKEIEAGTCKDFNAINNYINYLTAPFYHKK